MNLRTDLYRKVTLNRIKVGTKVTYYAFNIKEHGIVKSLSDDKHVFVVYNCSEDWDNYYNYTAERTEIINLVIGWK